MIALGVDGHPILQPGVHLRWTFDPDLGFPTGGFDIFRRPHQSGVPKTLDFQNQQPHSFQMPIQLGPTTWTTTDTNSSRFEQIHVGSDTLIALTPPMSVTCRLQQQERPVRQIQLDMVNWELRLEDLRLSLWGVAGEEHVTQESALILTNQNRGQALSFAVSGDALEGFQLRGAGMGYSIVRVHWTSVVEDAEVGWGAPLNIRRIGLPVTVPGYTVPHAYSPDDGSGQQDWHEAADRLSPTGSSAQLPPALAQRFGLPVFLGTRDLMRKAISRQLLVAPASDQQPQVTLDPVSLTLLVAIDPDFSRLLGLGFVDRSAVTGQHYDYRVVGYWTGLVLQLVCVDVPQGGSNLPTGGSTTLPGSAGGNPIGVIVNAVPASSAKTLEMPQKGKESDVPTSLERSLTFSFSEGIDQVRIQGQSDRPDPLTVSAYVGGQMVASQLADPGSPQPVTINWPGITSVVVSGTNTVVTQICRLQLVQETITETWICFDVVRGAVPALEPPGPIAGRALPGFAGNGHAEQVVGLTIEPHLPADPDLLPAARLPLGAMAYEVSRRDDGDQPIPAPASGTWVSLSVDANGNLQPVFRSRTYPTLYKSPLGWPTEVQDYIDDTLNPDVRYYSYRARGYDLFGRVSDWSPPVSVDAADTTAPPAPDQLAARWIDGSDPWLEDDDAAALAAAQAANIIRVRWSWSLARRQQAPDTKAFRVYWNSTSFSVFTGTITSVQVSSDVTSYTLQVTLDQLGSSPPSVDAFAQDWLRQGNRQYLVRSSTGGSPTTLVVSGVDVEPPVVGPCAISLRAPDPQRLDHLGNPLRPDPSSPLPWERRLLQSPLVTVTGTLQQEAPGAAVDIQEIKALRAGVTTAVLAPTWHWSGTVQGGWQLVASGATYPVLGGTLGITAKLLIDTSQHAPPQPGPATLSDVAGQVRTYALSAAFPNAVPLTLVGGTVSAGITTLAVLGHRVSPSLQIVLSGTAPLPEISWFPDYEVLLQALSLPVSATTPHATGVVGVSALDSRTYIPDKRQHPDGPTGPGNEGPIATVPVERHYFGRPTTQPAPDGTSGTGSLWASVPDEFSGISRYLLRWPVANVTRFHVYHATLDAVLDADMADRAAIRGAYAGLPPLSGAALMQWRAQQSALNAQSLQALATAQPLAFTQLTQTPLSASDPLLTDSQTGWMRWSVPLDGSAPGRHFLRLAGVDEAGNLGDPGPATLPITVPDARRPLPPGLRRVIDGDRCIWLVWDARDPKVESYQVYRTLAVSGSAPDIRDMTAVAILPAHQCPEPSAVFKGAVQLAGPTPHTIVAIYRAEEYNTALSPDAQTATPLAGTFSLTGSTLSGLDSLPDGSLVFVTARYTEGGTAELVVPVTGCAYRDTGMVFAQYHQYRIVAVRQATVGAGVTKPVRSFASDVGEGAAFDLTSPVAPPGSVVWLPQQQAVHITWTSAGLPSGLEVLIQRMDQSVEAWVRASDWILANVGFADDAAIETGHAYLYRLRVRNTLGRTSQNEALLGPVTIP